MGVSNVRADTPGIGLRVTMAPGASGAWQSLATYAAVTGGSAEAQAGGRRASSINGSASAARPRQARAVRREKSSPAPCW